MCLDIILALSQANTNSAWHHRKVLTQTLCAQLSLFTYMWGNGTFVKDEQIIMFVSHTHNCTSAIKYQLFIGNFTKLKLILHVRDYKNSPKKKP